MASSPGIPFRQALLFSLNCFAAALLALYLAMALDLQRPYWAMLTVYITSTPMSGAVRSKAAFRLAGTLLGAIVAVVLVPNLVNSPAVLSLALAAWAAGCLTLSLLDRRPRSYALMLAGYTAALVGFPVVGQPQAVFDVAVARVEEIGLGIICATAVHSLVFPRPVGQALAAKLSQWLASADAWLLDLAAGSGDRADDLRQLAAAAGELRLLATHLPFDTSRQRETRAAAQALDEQMLRLMPLLSGLDDRLQALQEAGAVPADVVAALQSAAAWLHDGAALDPGLALAEDLRARAEAAPASGWTAMLTASLLRLLAEAVAALARAHALQAHVQAPDAPLPEPVAAALAEARARPLHRDTGLALRSGLTCLLAVLGSCAFWIASGWPDGATAAAMAAVFCSLFATLDDPAPSLASFGLVSIATLTLAAVYDFGVLRWVDGYLPLALALLPPLLLFGFLMGRPATAGAGMALSVTFSSALGLQARPPTDFAAFVNSNLGVYAALLIALALTRLLRSLTTDAAVLRLRRLTWRGIARLARGWGPGPAATDAAALLGDRLALLAPRLQRDGDDAVAAEALRDLRLAMNLLRLRAECPGLDTPNRRLVEQLQRDIAEHFGALAARQAPRAFYPLLVGLDTLLARLSGAGPGPERRAVVALVGLRRNLFPWAGAPVTLRAQP